MNSTAFKIPCFSVFFPSRSILDVKIRRIDEKDPTKLVMEATAKTYRYLDEGEQSKGGGKKR